MPIRHTAEIDACRARQACHLRGLGSDGCSTFLPGCLVGHKCAHRTLTDMLSTLRLQLRIAESITLPVPGHSHWQSSPSGQGSLSYGGCEVAWLTLGATMLPHRRPKKTWKWLLSLHGSCSHSRCRFLVATAGSTCCKSTTCGGLPAPRLTKTPRALAILPWKPHSKPERRQHQQQGTEHVY